MPSDASLEIEIEQQVIGYIELSHLHETVPTIQGFIQYMIESSNET